MKLNPQTLAAQAPGHPDKQTGAVVPPIHLSTTFERDEGNRLLSKHLYARPDNPTFEPVEGLLTALEGGASTLLFSSGMAAATALFLSLPPGSHVIAPRVMYWALRSWLVTDAPRHGLDVELVDCTQPDDVARAIRPGKTSLIWLETPANPTWAISDIAAIAAIAHDARALVAVDSTCATPVLSRPLSLGADVVMHAATKYLGGHGDVLAGTLTAARDDELWARVRRTRAMLGAVPGGLEAFLLLRGMRTLHLRVREASCNAMHIAQHLASHPRVSRVLYPGLEAHPGHEVAARQMQGGFGGMLSFCVHGGAQAALRTLGALTVIRRATSLGGVESLAEHRHSIEGEGSPATPDMIRLSVGIEHPGDLVADLDDALERA